MIAYARPYCGRGCVLHMLGAGAGGAAEERAAFERLCSNLTHLADKLMAGVKGHVAEYNAFTREEPAAAAKAEDALVALRLTASYVVGGRLGWSGLGWGRHGLG